MSKRIVVALGGNALGKNLPEQMQAVQVTSKAIVDLIEQGNEVVVVHGNGPQVGMIANAMTELTRSDPEKYIPCPLSVCGAMSQGYIGYDLQNALREEMERRGIDKGVATVLTQVEVDPADPAFENPTKPIGSFMSKEEAESLKESRGYDFVEDSGRGYRRVVASPRPKRIVELDTISSLVAANHVVIACGGGGIPVEPTGNHHLKGAAAVIDKDFAAELLAESLDADYLVISRPWRRSPCALESPTRSGSTPSRPSAPTSWQTQASLARAPWSPRSWPLPRSPRASPAALPSSRCSRRRVTASTARPAPPFALKRCLRAAPWVELGCGPSPIVFEHAQRRVSHTPTSG